MGSLKYEGVTWGWLDLGEGLPVDPCWRLHGWDDESAFR